MGELPPPVPACVCEVREDSPIYASPRLKEFVIEAERKGQITATEVESFFVQYGLRGT